MAYIPKGVVHATHNATRRPLTFLAILSPASSKGPAVIDYSNAMVVEPSCGVVGR